MGFRFVAKDSKSLPREYGLWITEPEKGGLRYVINVDINVASDSFKVMTAVATKHLGVGGIELGRYMQYMQAGK